MTAGTTSCPAPQAEVRPTGVEGDRRRPRIAVFSLTSCEGCSLAILELEDRLLEILSAVEIVNFREAASERCWEIDIGFVDGAVTTPHDEQAARHFRTCCRTLVAIGACACLGGVNALKDGQPTEDCRRAVYGNQAWRFPSGPTRPLPAVVPVDYELPGCPMAGSEFLRFLKCWVARRPFRLPVDPVCVECKRRGNLCMYERGEVCLGPATRGGCGAICPAYGVACQACRGVLNGERLRVVLANLRARGADMEQVRADLARYGAYTGELP